MAHQAENSKLASGDYVGDTWVYESQENRNKWLEGKDPLLDSAILLLIIGRVRLLIQMNQAQAQAQGLGLAQERERVE